MLYRVISLSDYGLKTKHFDDCLKDATKTKKYNDSVLVCAKELQTICEQSPIRVIKTIRLDLSTLTPLLSMLPSLKIVHLIRDPRATMLSQSRAGMCSDNEGGKYGCSSRYCYRLENDVLEHETITKDYQGRISPVYYEQIARFPLEASGKMYKFIEANYTKPVMQYVYNITMSGAKDDCGICSTRSNSSEHINAWKKTMPTEFIDIVEDRCHYVLKRFHYEFTKIRRFKY